MPALAPPQRLCVAVVEDDVELREAILVPALAAAGHQVIGVGSAVELYRTLVADRLDIVVLDVGLPGESGFEIARHLRAYSSIGIILLTGRSSAADRVRGLDLGADVYLPKPFDTEVLCATVRSLARRLASTQALAGPSHRGWSLGADGWQLVTPNGKALELNMAERQLLRVLFAALHTPVPRERLIAHLTDDAYAFDPHRLDMLVHRLRRKVAEAGAPELPLRAVRGVGYVLVADAREGGDA
jgi:DNA-binding response OmpR family regulator